MLINKVGDMTPYNMGRKPYRQNTLLLPLIWIASWFMTRSGKLKIQKIGLDELNPPYLVLSQNQGFSDYYITPLALFHRRANYVSDVEGFAAFGKWLYRRIGCVATRRYAGDPALVRNIRHVVEKNGDIIVIYPEARHSNVGTHSALPKSVGKLVKLLGLPVVVQKLHGSYLTSPIWDEEHRRKVPLCSTLEKVLTPEDITSLSAEEITTLLNEHFKYDEYRWQYENGIRIDYANRSEGLHNVLYLCPNCRMEYAMRSHAYVLECAVCGKAWEMDEFGRLSATECDTEFPHIPDWYEYERHETQKQIASGTYHLNVEVLVDAIPNEKGFVHLGKGHLTHNADGFVFAVADQGGPLHFSSRAMYSVHTEYNYRGKGNCVVLSTRGCCYYLYPVHNDCNVTKIQFAAEEFYARVKSNCSEIIKNTGKDIKPFE